MVIVPILTPGVVLALMVIALIKVVVPRLSTLALSSQTPAVDHCVTPPAHIPQCSSTDPRMLEIRSDSIEAISPEIVHAGTWPSASSPHATWWRDSIQTYLRNMERVPCGSRTRSGAEEKARASVIDWLADIHKGERQSLHLAMACFDEALADSAAPSARLSGLACLYVACKYEGDGWSHLSEFARRGACTTDELLSAESAILERLNFNIGPALCTTSKLWLDHYMASAGDSADDTDHNTVWLCDYLLEISLASLSVHSKFPPSVVAASAIRLARHVYKQPVWTASLSEISGYDGANLPVHLCTLKLHGLLRNTTKRLIRGSSAAPPCLAIKRYYECAQRGHVALLPVPTQPPIASAQLRCAACGSGMIDVRAVDPGTSALFAKCAACLE